MAEITQARQTVIIMSSYDSVLFPVVLVILATWITDLSHWKLTFSPAVRTIERA